MTPKEMIRFLKRNGFRIISQHGSHCKLKNRRTGYQTVVPMHNNDLSNGTEQAILKQANLQITKSNKKGKLKC